MAPPRILCPEAEWVPDESCEACPRCGEDFHAVFLRRHHCRVCGRCFCDECSSWRVEVEDGGIFGRRRAVRSCYECFTSHRPETTPSTEAGFLQRLSDWFFGVAAEPARPAPSRRRRQTSLDADALFDDDDAVSEFSVATTRRRRASGKAGPASSLRREARQARERARAPLPPVAPREVDRHPRLTRAALDALSDDKDGTEERRARRRATTRTPAGDFGEALREAVNARRWTRADQLLRVDARAMLVDAQVLSVTNIGRAVGRLARDRRVPHHVRAAAADAVAHWREIVARQTPRFSQGDAVLYFFDPNKKSPRDARCDATVVAVAKDRHDPDNPKFRYIVALEYDGDTSSEQETDGAHLEPKPPEELADL
ncbi:hypothetical protein CTAYLR_002141 [Chrysophaeum taylorii]|uniref:FYVE-type domain-containing protein n=1 Tax=Chrysophaeum taylorii TaxID=2483200 RepID=A0AAD7UN80_9STRA|nr:hypothetical protein CTAYLR_002141 [Chrysophaeum taylorii]